MRIRHARFDDWNDIVNIYAYARGFMADTGNPNQWGTGNPPEDTLRNDIAMEQLYLVEDDGVICGSFAFILGEDPTYGLIDGAWHSNAPYGTIHRIAGNGKRKGILAAAVAFCASITSYLRIDTHKDNKIMQHLVEKNGFSYCGIIYLANGDPRLAYDRMK